MENLNMTTVFQEVMEEEMWHSENPISGMLMIRRGNILHNPPKNKLCMLILFILTPTWLCNVMLDSEVLSAGFSACDQYSCYMLHVTLQLWKYKIHTLYFICSLMGLRIQMRRKWHWIFSQHANIISLSLTYNCNCIWCLNMKYPIRSNTKV